MSKDNKGKIVVIGLGVIGAAVFGPKIIQQLQGSPQTDPSPNQGPPPSTPTISNVKFGLS